MLTTNNPLFVLQGFPFACFVKLIRQNSVSKINVLSTHFPFRFYSIFTSQGTLPNTQFGPKMPTLHHDRSEERALKNLSDLHQYDPEQVRLMEEMCITVDTNDNIIGFDTKFKTHLWDNIQANNILHRAFSIFLFNENYELLLQRRSNEKITFPGCWTNTCCSHPLYLENEKNGVDGCRNAGLRKLIHELGIIHSPPLTYLTRIHYKAFSNEKWGEHEIDYIFFGQGSFHVEPKPNEVLDIQYVNESKLRELLKLAETHPDQVKITPWFKMICENNLFKWWQHLRNGTLESCVEASEIFRMS